MVIEDPTPSPPPKPLTLPATTAPLAGAASKAPAYKPGSAVYEIPWAKHDGAAAPADNPAAAHGVTATPPATKALAAAVPAPAKGAPKPTPKPVVLPPPTWQARVGSTLRESMQAWAVQAGWTLRWEATAINYPIVAPLHFTGTYVKAVSSAISAYAHADQPLWVCLYTQQQLTRVTDSPCKVKDVP